jgi:hypothetical protein
MINTRRSHCSKKGGVHTAARKKVMLWIFDDRQGTAARRRRMASHVRIRRLESLIVRFVDESW